MRQRRWIDLFSDYDCKIRYHPGKANVVADALSRKERAKPKIVRAMNMTLQSNIKDRILTAQKEGDVRTLIMDEAYKWKYSVHPGANKMYYDLRDRYWWLGMKNDIAVYAARDRKKIYADKRRKPLEFSVSDYVLLKVSHWKGVVCFGKKGKQAPRFIGPFEIVEKVGIVAYLLGLPKELNGVHDTFHVSNLKKCLADPTLQVPLDEIQVDDKLNFIEEDVEIMEREFKKLKQSGIAIVKVRWNSKCGPEFMWEREDQIMPPTMMTQSVGRPAAASLRGGTGGRADRGGGRTRGCSGDQGDGRNDGPGGQVGAQGSEVNGSQVRGQGVGRNQNGDAVYDHIRGDVRNATEGNDHRGCTYKEFLTCNRKEYDGKGGAIVYTRWIEKMESIHDMSGCRDSQRVKYTAGSFIGKALTWWNSEIRTWGREATVGKSWEYFKTLTREEFCSSNEMQKLETELWNHAMVGAGHAAYTDWFYELARLVPHIITLEGKKIKRNGSIKKNAEKRGNGGEPSKDKNGSCFNCNGPGDFARDCRVVLRNVNLINARNPVARTCYECGSTDHIKLACPRINQAQRPRGNHQNQVVAVNGGLGRGNKGDLARGMEFIMGAEEARPNSNIITRMDWLSDHKTEIICHEKVVRIPLLDGKVLRVLGEKLKENIRQLISVNGKEKKQEEIVVVRDFPEVFPDDLSGLLPVREIKFQIELIPEAMPVARSPYHLAPSELEELSGQLKEL
ncbi:putative reverse transcriptase domain-containing protein [Tanacetum coccineum]